MRGSNPSLPTNKGLQETADPFALLWYNTYKGNALKLLDCWDIESEAKYELFYILQQADI